MARRRMLLVSYSAKLFSTFHVTFINIINVDKNNKGVYYFL